MIWFGCIITFFFQIFPFEFIFVNKNNQTTPWGHRISWLLPMTFFKSLYHVDQGSSLNFCDLSFSPYLSHPDRYSLPSKTRVSYFESIWTILKWCHFTEKLSVKVHNWKQQPSQPVANDVSTAYSVCKMSRCYDYWQSMFKVFHS